MHSKNLLLHNLISTFTSIISIWNEALFINLLHISQSSTHVYLIERTANMLMAGNNIVSIILSKHNYFMQFVYAYDSKTH